MTDSTPRRRSRTLVAVVGVLLAVVVAARIGGDVAVTDVVGIPDAGSVAVELLDNGTPVFVVHGPPADDGGPAVVDVIQAFTPEVEGPVTGLVGWCAGSQQFTQPHLGPLYDVRGRRLPTSTTGRLPQADLFGGHTALDDLVHREVTRVAGRDQPDDPLVVGGPRQLQDFQVADRPALSPTVPPDRCRHAASPADADGSGRASDADGPDAQGLRLLDHGFLAAPLDPAASGWQIATGWLAIQPDGTAGWCAEEPALDRTPDGSWRTTCAAEPAGVDVAFALPPADVGGVPTVIGDPLAARTADGAVQRVAVLPGSTWRGSSLRGTAVVTGTLTGVEGAPHALLLTGVADSGSCHDRWLPTHPTAGGRRVPVEPGTPVAIRYGPVAVSVDVVTCRALRVDPQG